MTVTNTDEKVVDDDKTVDEDDLRDLKYPKDDVETSKEADETSKGDEDEEDSEDTGEEDSKTDDSQDDDSEEDAKTDSAEDDSEFGSTPRAGHPGARPCTGRYARCWRAHDRTSQDPQEHPQNGHSKGRR